MPPRSSRAGSSSRATQRATYAALCDDLEPRVLHQLGFAAAVAALRAGCRARHDVAIDLDVAHAARASARTPQSLCTRSSARRPSRLCGAAAPTRIEISLRATEAGGVELVVADDGPPERRAAVLEALAERAATLNGRFSSEARYPRGSTLRIDVPPAAAHR